MANVLIAPAKACIITLAANGKVFAIEAGTFNQGEEGWIYGNPGGSDPIPKIFGSFLHSPRESLKLTGLLAQKTY